MTENESNEVFERLRESEKRLTMIEVTLWGTNGDNGLRSDIRELKSKMDTLLRFFWVATAIPPLTIGIIAIFKFFGKI